MLDKTNLLLTEIIPRSQESYGIQIEQRITEHQRSFMSEINKLFASKPSEDVLMQFIKQFETKTSGLLQPLLTYVTMSEERIQKSVQSIHETKATQDKVMEGLLDHMNKSKYRNSTYKGKASESQLEDILNGLYPTCYIRNTSNIPNNLSFKVCSVVKLASAHSALGLFNTSIKVSPSSFKGESKLTV